MSIGERFWSKVDRTTESQCWTWTGAVRNGYGAFKINGKTRSSHHVALALSGKTVPDGLVVDHACRNRACVNPAHLRFVTARQNVLENSAGHAAINAAKLFCPRGHEYTKQNTRIWQNRRVCRACQREHQKAYRQRKAK